MMRTSRLAEIFKEEISDIIQRELKDPRIGFVTITAVEVSPDLRYATVFLSVLGKKLEQENTLEGLESAKGFIKTELGKRIRIKFLPDLTFKIDESIKEGMRISELLKRIQKGD
ncbi:MAG: 30S ribosome-binding factor RbfA [Actinomycetota bacterium]